MKLPMLRVPRWAPLAVAAAVAAVAMTCGLSAASARPSRPASHPPLIRSATTVAVLAGYATVAGDEDPSGVGVALPSTKAFNSSFQPVVLRQVATGFYEVHFQGLGDPSVVANTRVGVVHTRILGPDGSCVSNFEDQLNDGSPDGGIFVGVICYDASGNPADRPFTVSYTRGGTQAGQLVTAHIDTGALTDSNGNVVVSDQSSSIGGTVTAQRNSSGIFTFNLPALTGAGPSTIAVSPSASAQEVAPPAECSVQKTALIDNATIKRVVVLCESVGGPTSGRTADPGIAITYAKGVNILGIAPNRLSNAYFSYPQTTAFRTVLGALQAVNQNFGQIGAPITVLREQPGFYQIDLGSQEAGLPPNTTIVTATSGTAVCRANPSVTIPGNEQTALTMIVKCTDVTGRLIDSAFQLQYSAAE